MPRRESTMLGAQILVPVLLRRLSEMERGDPRGWLPSLEHFFLQGRHQYGRRAVLVAIAVASVRYARQRSRAEECRRIEALLREVGHGGA